MKSYLYRLPFVLALTTLFNTAYAAEPVLGFYAGGMGTVSYVPSVNNYSINTPTSLSTPYGAITTQAVSLNYSVGGGGAGEIGFRFDCLRIGAELFYNRNNMGQIKYGSITIGDSSSLGLPYFQGQTTQFGALANFYYDFYDLISPETEWVPYVGIGIGYSNIRSNIRFFDANQTFIVGTETVTRADIAMGQGIIGLSYYADDVSDFFLDLRYLTTQKNNTDLFTHRQLYTINLGFNFIFDEISLS